jgi:hypothetical protein
MRLTAKSTTSFSLYGIINAISLSFLLLAGITMASPIDNLKKVGEAKLKVLFWDVYNSTLYNQTGQYQVDEYPIALNINYLRNIDAEDLIKSSEEEWDKLGLKKQQYEKWLPLLTNLLPDIKKGDTILLHVNETKQSEFFYNGNSIGVISDSEFGSSFLRIWLDENSSYPKVRNKLVGLKK